MKKNYTIVNIRTQDWNIFSMEKEAFIKLMKEYSQWSFLKVDTRTEGMKNDYEYFNQQRAEHRKKKVKSKKKKWYSR